MTAALQPISLKKPRGHSPRLSKPYVPGKRAARFWTEQQLDILRGHYESKGAAFCQAKLKEMGVERGLGPIYQKARKLELSTPHRDTSVSVTPEHEQEIRDAWPSLEGRGAVEALAEELGLDRWQVSKVATRLGLTMPHKKEPPWTAAELALMERVPLHDPERCSDIFREHGYRRTPAAITVKAKRLDLSRRYCETFSGTACARVIGVDNKTFCTWCAEGLVKASRRETKRLPQQGGHPWSITRADFRAFIIAHLDRIDFRKVDKFALVDVLTNTKEPNGSTGDSHA